MKIVGYYLITAEEETVGRIHEAVKATCVSEGVRLFGNFMPAPSPCASPESWGITLNALAVDIYKSEEIRIGLAEQGCRRETNAPASTQA